VENCVYATVLLTAPASVEIVSGEKSTTLTVEAGLHHLSAPLAPGRQTFAIKRDGKTVVEATGARPIDASAEVYNFETYSGLTTGKLEPK
jgi:glucan endo-1,3-alpha-glucosidase